jgi:hypothetical protein
MVSPIMIWCARLVGGYSLKMEEQIVRNIRSLRCRQSEDYSPNYSHMFRAISISLTLNTETAMSGSLFCSFRNMLRGYTAHTRVLIFQSISIRQGDKDLADYLLICQSPLLRIMLLNLGSMWVKKSLYLARIRVAHIVLWITAFALRINGFQMSAVSGARGYVKVCRRSLWLLFDID